MFFQLGNIVFKGLLSPHSFNIEGDEATYAEYELIGSKTRLKKTGDTLQEINLDLRLHAEFCNPTAQIAALKAAKENGTILPFLWGDGRYVSDYVIIKFPYTIDNAFSDGTIIQATVNLTLKEYISYDLLEQKQLAARKDAFAVGTKNAIAQRPPQPITSAKQVAQTAASAQQQTSKINGLVSDMQQNATQANIIGNKILAAAKKASGYLQDINDQLDNARAIADTFKMIRSAAGSLAASTQAVISLYPYSNIDDLTQLNNLLQGSTSSLGLATNGLMQSVITRQPIPAN